MKKVEIYKRLYSDYSKKFLDKIVLAGFFSILVAGSTSAIAWLLDPAIKKLFIEKDQSLIILIPFMIIVAFTTKGLSLYFAKATITEEYPVIKTNSVLENFFTHLAKASSDKSKTLKRYLFVSQSFKRSL